MPEIWIQIENRPAPKTAARCPIRFGFQLWLTRRVCFWINFDFMSGLPFLSGFLVYLPSISIIRQEFPPSKSGPRWLSQTITT